MTTAPPPAPGEPDVHHAPWTLVVAGVAALAGKKTVEEAAPPVPTRAVASVETDVQEIKESVKR